MKEKVKHLAVIGDKQQVLLFYSVNAEVCISDNAEEAILFLKQCSQKKIKYVFISDYLLKNILKKYDLFSLFNEIVISALPDEKSVSVSFSTYIEQLLIRAVGTNIGRNSSSNKA
jgi:vacuolar-type H+-ATPase subunit F/Vma7